MEQAGTIGPDRPNFPNRFGSLRMADAARIRRRSSWRSRNHWAALAAGVPSIIVPHPADQPFWCDIISAKELGPRPIPRKGLSAARLANAIRTITTDDRYRLNTQRLASKIADEDGVKTAVQITDNWFAKL
jgi:hypothetical protein